MKHSSQNKALVFLLLLFTAIGVSFANISQKSIDSTIQSISSLHKQAMQFNHQDDYQSALETLESAARIAELNEDFKGLISTYHLFAKIYLQRNDVETANFYWDRASILLKGTEYPYGEAVHKFIDAIKLFKTDNNFQALNTLTEAKELNNDRNLLNNILLLEADIYLAIEKFDDATSKYNALIVNSDNIEREYIATKANLGLADLNYKNGNLEQSIRHGEAALKISKRNNYLREIITSIRMLTKSYEAQEQYDQSLLHYKTLSNINDSISFIEKSKTETSVSDRIKFQTQNSVIARLEEEKEKLSQSASRSEVTAILTSAFLTIISFLAISLYRNNQIKLKTNDLLYSKNKELEFARDSAISAMKAKSNFLSTVTHELRTPLYAVTGLTHLLLEENPGEHQKEHLKSLKFSGDYLLNFINDILQINKIDADKLEPLKIEFKPKKILNDVIDSLQTNAKENNTKVLLNFDNEIPLNLIGDPLKLSQIFINLVGNAIKFTKDGQVEVTAKLKEKTEEQVVLYFEVADNGIGISEEKQKNIFESFEQGSVQINREYGGTGLGLAIVKSLLGLFNAEIGLESELGVGSTFFFELDLKYEKKILSEIPFEMQTEEFEFEGLHLLVVEDNKINQVITKKMLSKKGITCDIANNGNEAIDLTKANTYDAILMDIHMPGISGEEATIQIRKFNKEIPIIALTAISMDDSVESFYAAGCNDVVTKPFKPEVFYEKIGKHIFLNENKIEDNV